jgi:calcineurin-like phosphoesterase family protein
LTEAGVSECINTIVNNHNSVVQDDDTVIHLGDLAHGKDQSKKLIGGILNAHKGKRILVKGNHDEYPDSFYKNHFLAVHYYLIKDNFFFCHYPLYKSKWNIPKELELMEIFKNSGCDTIIHGHVHNKDPNDWEPDGIKRINACVDFEPNNYFPIDITDLISS